MPKFLRPFETYANYYEPVRITATLSASAALTVRQDAWGIIAWSPGDATGLRSIPDAGLTPYLYDSEDQVKLALDLIADSRYVTTVREWATVSFWKRLRDDVVTFSEAEDGWPGGKDRLPAPYSPQILTWFLAWKEARP